MRALDHSGDVAPWCRRLIYLAADKLKHMDLATKQSRRIVGVSGVAAVALLLFGTRWGSYLGYAPLFVTDLLLLAAFIYWLIIDSVTKQKRINSGRSTYPGMALLAFLILVLVRAIVSPEVLTMDWLRDVMPFFYAAVALLSAAAYASSGPVGQAQTMRLLWWALNGHLAWTLLVNFGIINSMGMPYIPGSNVPIFSQRPDMDMAVLGMTAALYLRRIILGRRRTTSLLGFFLCSAAVAGFSSRAGLLAVFVALGVAYLCTLAADKKHGRKQNWIVLTPILLLLVGAILPQVQVGERLLATVGIEEATTQHQLNALGTANAREQAWTQIIDWTNQETTRALVGAGFGPNIVSESGAEDGLSGTQYENVRSPHNWLVGVHARLGLLGVATALLAILLALCHVWRIRRSIGSSELLTLAATGMMAILPVAILGVVLESPFGAIPFWWFYGILISERRLGQSINNHSLNARSRLALPA